MMATSQASLLPESANNLTPASNARAFFDRLSEQARDAISQRKPWLELVDRNSFSKPGSVTEAMSRIRKNLAYFRTNYLLLLSGILCLSLFAHPVSLFMLVVLLGAWAFLYFFRSEPLVMFNRSFSEREVLLAMSGLTIVLLFLTDVGSLIISALMFGVAIIALHGAFRVPDDLFLDEQEPASAGFLPFLGTAPAQQPQAVVSRV